MNTRPARASDATPSLASPLLDLRDAREPARCGNKAASLADLARRGFSVPDGVVVPVDVIPTAASVAHALERLGGGPVAVRSSGVDEDGARATWAGQFATFLGVEGVEAVLDAVSRCRASATSAHARAYARTHGASGGGLAVIIQRMVAADAAGVAFSADPVTGDTDVVCVSATRGLGDALVSGEVVADEWAVRDGEAVPVATPQAALDAAAVAEVAALARAVERARGCPQDIEWARADGVLSLLQARPIVDLPLRPEVEVPAGRWAKDAAHYPGPVTPLGETSYVTTFGPAADAMFAEWGLMPERMETRCIGYECYARFLPESGKAPPWWLLAIVARLAPSIRRKLERAATLVASGAIERVAASWGERLRPGLAARIAGFRDVALARLGDAELVSHFDAVCAFAHEAVAVHFRVFIPYLVGLYDLSLVCRDHLGWDDAQTIALVQGLSHASSAPTRELRAVAARVAGNPAARAIVVGGAPDLVEALGPVDPEAAAALRAWLGAWGFRCVDYDPGQPTLAERPERVAELLRDLVEAPAADDLEARRQALIAEARGQLTGPGRAAFDAALAFAERVYPIREDNIVYTDSLPGGLIRRAALEIGRRLVARGLLERATDAAYLRVDELRGLPEARASFAPVAARRRREMAWVRANPGPATYGEPEPPPPDIRGLPAAARRLNGAVLWAMAAEMSPPAPPAGDGVAGIAASAGVYTGTARVVRDAAELHTLRSGEVLVCPITTPSWAVYFSRAGALVTDGGSVLSHAAVIAREHGVPAVVATTVATSRLTTGMTVTVDGARGMVTIGPT